MTTGRRVPGTPIGVGSGDAGNDALERRIARLETALGLVRQPLVPSIPVRRGEGRAIRASVGELLRIVPDPDGRTTSVATPIVPATGLTNQRSLSFGVQVLSPGGGAIVIDAGRDLIEDPALLLVSGSAEATVHSFTSRPNVAGGLSAAWTWDGNGTWCLDAGMGASSISVAQNLISSSISVVSQFDNDASYLVLANTASLDAERVLTPGTGLAGTDAGANSTYTLAVDGTVARISGSHFTGNVSSAGTGSFALGISGSLTRLTTGVSFLVAGTNVTISSASNGQVTITVPVAADFDWRDLGNALHTTSSVAIGQTILSGSDTVFVVSGWTGGKGNQGTSVFRGDLLVSGNLWVTGTHLGLRVMDSPFAPGHKVLVLGDPPLAGGYPIHLHTTSSVDAAIMLQNSRSAGALATQVADCYIEMQSRGDPARGFALGLRGRNGQFVITPSTGLEEGGVGHRMDDDGTRYHMHESMADSSVITGSQGSFTTSTGSNTTGSILSIFPQAEFIYQVEADVSAAASGAFGFYDQKLRGLFRCDENGTGSLLGQTSLHLTRHGIAVTNNWSASFAHSASFPSFYGPTEVGLLVFGDTVTDADWMVRSTVMPMRQSMSSSAAGAAFLNGASLHITGTTSTNIVTGSDIQGTLNSRRRATFSYWTKSQGTWTHAGDENVWMRRRLSTGGNSIQFIISHGNGIAQSNSRDYMLKIQPGVTAGTVAGVAYNGPEMATQFTWPNTWHHVVHSLDFDLGAISGSAFGGSGEGSMYRCWVDGVEVFHSGAVTGTVSQTHGHPTSFISSSAHWTFGATLTVSTAQRVNPFGPGNLDEVAVWPGLAMSASQVAEVYNGGSPPDLNDLPTVAAPDYWFRCGDTVGDTFANDGAFSNANGSEVLRNVFVTGSGYSTDVP